MKSHKDTEFAVRRSRRRYKWAFMYKGSPVSWVDILSHVFLGCLMAYIFIEMLTP